MWEETASKGVCSGSGASMVGGYITRSNITKKILEEGRVRMKDGENGENGCDANQGSRCFLCSHVSFRVILAGLEAGLMSAPHR